MSNVAMCRVCLVTDVRTHPIVDTPLQEIFTKFTNIAISPEDGKPSLLCYVCHHQLKKCLKFNKRALKTDELLSQVIHGGVLKISDLNTQQNQLCISPVEVIAVVEEENIQSIEVKEEILVKHEELKEEKFEEPAHSGIDDNGFWQSDSDDNIPLHNFSAKRTVKKRRVKVKREDKGPVTDFAREIILSKEQQMEEMIERSFSVNYKNSPLKCELCYKGFIDVQAYDKHRDKHDEKSGPYACDICHMRYKTQRQLRTHSTSSHSRQYACLKCPHRSHTVNQAREHEQWHDGYTYECKLCGQKFRKHTTYLTHKRKRHPTHHTCPICGHSFVGRHGLLMHQSKSHPLTSDKQPELPSSPASSRHCSGCDIQFVTRDAWQRHILSRTQACFQDSTKCRICDLTLPSRVALGLHLRDHERALKPRPPRPTKIPRVLVELSCDQCGVNFVNRAKLQAHVKRIHLGLKYNKNMVCEVCGKKCTSNASLKYHQRTHTGERPYQCGTCAKRFSDKNQLRIHIRTHTGERPYCCTVCGKRFSQKPALNRHFRVHTGDKPYTCQYCSKTFTQSNSLKLHIKTVHLKMANKRKAPQTVSVTTQKVENTADALPIHTL